MKGQLPTVLNGGGAAPASTLASAALAEAADVALGAPFGVLQL